MQPNEKQRLLFVDDEQNFLDVIGRILRDRRHQWELAFATNVDQALGRADLPSFDAIFTDFHMPGKNGLAFLEALQASDVTKDIPVIMLTGHADKDLKRRALDRGAADLLNKPFEREDLIARAQSVLKIKAYQDQLKCQNEILEQQVKDRTRQLRESQFEITMRLGKASEYRDEETGNHVIRVGCYSMVLAKALNMPADFVEILTLAAPLHDIGKIGISDGILLKTGKPTPEEWKIIQRHCAIGADILRQDPKALSAFMEYQQDRIERPGRKTANPVLKKAANIALEHHEKWNGQGYPQQLSGEDILMEARIVALADVYDALRSRRPYKPAYSEEKTIAIIREEAGVHFDPGLCEAFTGVIDEFNNIHERFSDEAEHI